MSTLPFDVALLSTVAPRPLILVGQGRDARPVSATAACIIEAPLQKVWDVIANPERFATQVPMIDKVKRTDDRVKIDLKFRVALFSVGFHILSRETHEDGKWIELSYLEGEPKDATIRFDVLPGNTPNQTALFAYIGFDISSLGWLVKSFLKHHPEIQFGVYPGSALSILDAVKRVAEGSGR